MKNNPKTAFDPFLDDYAYFEVHATEAQNDLEAYAAHLSGIEDGKMPIRMLDFGSGTGSFTRLFLKQAGWRPENECYFPNTGLKHCLPVRLHRLCRLPLWE